MYAWPTPEIPTLPLSQSGHEQLRLWDTAIGSLQPVGPAMGTARMYVCGITPYDATHLGHANTYLTFDLINRVWRDLGLAVHYTQNVTDVDDPLLERAQATGQEWEELAEEQTELFRSDMADLRVLPPNDLVGAVEAIEQVIAYIERLAATGFAYQVADGQYPDWYFNAAAAPGFGNIGHLSEAQMLQLFAERGGDPERPGKRNRLDCLLWRFARPGEPSWSSKLGAGRPGWHIECTAIAQHHLGEAFDVQGGGSDLIFPHHEMCAAQAQVCSGQPLAGAYVHSGMVALDGEKMSKSKGNLELVSRLRQSGAEPMAIRLALLDQHYRSDWEWKPELLQQATERLKLWRGVCKDPSAHPTASAIAELRACLREDLDAPGALRVVDAWAAASLAVDSDDAVAGAQMSAAVDALLGIAL